MSQALGPDQISRIRREFPEAVSLIRYYEEAGAGWKLIVGAPLPARGKSIQVRNIELIAPAREVSRIEQGYRRADAVPPPTLTYDGWVLDGNTRVAAMHKAKLATATYFRLDWSYEGAPEVIIKAMMTLGGALNDIHGKRMTDKNLERLILLAYQEGSDKSPKVLAAELHCSVSTVHNTLAEDRGRKRAVRLGFSEDAFNASLLKRFGGMEGKITDEVLLPLMELSLKAGFTVREVVDVAKQLEALHSDRERLALLKAEFAANSGRINYGSDRPSLAGQVRQGLGFLDKARVNPNAAIERDPEAGRQYLGKMITARATLSDLIAEQESVIKAQERDEEPAIATPRFNFGGKVKK